MVEPVESFLFGDKVIVKDEPSAQAIRDKGKFGEFVNKQLELSLSEALFLLERNKINVYDKRKVPLTLRGFVKKARVFDHRFWIRYSVYRDIRARGYITKEALKYGADFSIYPRGKDPKTAHSKWLLFAVSSDEIFDWRKFAAMNRVAHSVKKHLMIGIVDTMSDVTYYEIKWKRP